MYPEKYIQYLLERRQPQDFPLLLPTPPTPLTTSARTWRRRKWYVPPVSEPLVRPWTRQESWRKRSQVASEGFGVPWGGRCWVFSETNKKNMKQGEDGDVFCLGNSRPLLLGETSIACLGMCFCLAQQFWIEVDSISVLKPDILFSKWPYLLKRWHCFPCWPVFEARLGRNLNVLKSLVVFLTLSLLLDPQPFLCVFLGFATH